MAVMESFFSSKVRVSLLSLLLLNAEEKFYPLQVQKLKGLPYTAIRRELAKMEKLGLLFRTKEGNRSYYQVNKDFFLFSELKSMVLKTAGLGDVIRDGINKEDDILVAFIYGSYAKGEEISTSDIDVLVIGNLSSKRLRSLIAKAEGRVKRQINSFLYTPQELKRKFKSNNHFVKSVLNSPKIFIKGGKEDLRQIIK